MSIQNDPRVLGEDITAETPARHPPCWQPCADALIEEGRTLLQELTAFATQPHYIYVPQW